VKLDTTIMRPRSPRFAVIGGRVLVVPAASAFMD